MSSYSELIKNFEKIRAYMREFYVYGFKNRGDYRKKSARSYDDERRRMESWLGGYMRFVRTSEGKNMFISIDSRVSGQNPLYKAWKAKSFTSGDITLHFILFDILRSPDALFSVSELMEIIDREYLSCFQKPMVFDESTLRKKLKEYAAEGMIICEKQGKKMKYHRAESGDLIPDVSVLEFYSEIAPCGVIGSFLLDKCDRSEHFFDYKHHYITGAPDSDVLASLFSAMQEKCVITVFNLSRKADEPKRLRLIPLRIFISVQNGRQHLLAYHAESDRFRSFRIDYLSHVKREEKTPRFDELRRMLDEMQPKMWGVNCGRCQKGKTETEHVEFTVRVAPDEMFIVQRLEREKRVGKVEQIDAGRYRFTADVYDTNEMIPWIRTFICRIEQMNFSNRTAENRFKSDLEQMYRMYEMDGGSTHDLQ